jgi:Ca-activated chloride channel family protein
LFKWTNCLVLAALVLNAAVSPAGAATNPKYNFQATAEEVRLTFVVTDGSNRPVEGLRETDFAVVDNELVIRQFRSLNRTPQASLEVALLLDVSGSIASELKKEVAGLTQLMAELPWKPSDHVSVIWFGGATARVVCLGNCHRSWPAQDVNSLNANGLTPLFDAVALGVELVSEQNDPNFRRVVVVFSDGNDNISRNSVLDVIAKAQKSETQLYTVDISGPKRTAEGHSVLHTLATATGGLDFSREDNINAMLAAVLADLENGYVVTYAISNRTEGRHSVYMLPTRDLNLHFHCRNAYYYRKADQQSEVKP